MRFSVVRGALGVALAANAFLVVLVGCGRAPVAAPAPASSSIPAANLPSAAATQAALTPVVFVGSAACAECHQAQYLSQSHSRHAKTLLVMSRAALGGLAPPTGPVVGSGLVVASHADRFGMGFAAHPESIQPLDFALGSGKTGMTYVSLVDGRSVAEWRMSYFPHSGKWYVTPGDAGLDPRAMARVLPPEDARTCFHCHAVMESPQTVVPARRFFGVGCESCHGAGGAHIAQMRAGKYDHDSMERLETWPATRLLALCGQCHGAAMEGSHPVTTDQTNRFQPAGLVQSQCFQRSGGALSCLTCHDSHRNVSTNAKAYEAVCLTCHTSAAAHRPPTLRTAVVSLCPVNPKGNCITCHMPSRKMFASGPVPTLMADHFIRVQPHSTPAGTR